MRPGRVLLALASTSILGFASPGAHADTYPRQPGVDVVQYSFRLTLRDASDEIEGEAAVDFRVQQDGLETLSLDLVQPKPPAVAKGMTVSAVTEGDKAVSFEPLLVIDGEQISIGTPNVDKAKVTAEVISEDIQADKVTAIRYKAKKRVHKVRGHRQHQTEIKITKIS